MRVREVAQHGWKQFQTGKLGTWVFLATELLMFGGLFCAKGYDVWHAGASWRVVRGVEVFGRVENLFDRAYEEALGFPAPGRTAMAGIRVAAGR